MGGEHRDRAHALGWYGRSWWRRRALRQLKDHPLCRLCLELKSQIVPAEVADHVEPHGGDWRKFRFGALQSLCKNCHSSAKHSIELHGFSKEIGPDGWPVDPRHPCYAKR
jgi:5-methylcytosine-specific restriction protein A